MSEYTWIHEPETPAFFETWVLRSVALGSVGSVVRKRVNRFDTSYRTADGRFTTTTHETLEEAKAVLLAEVRFNT